MRVELVIAPEAELDIAEAYLCSGMKAGEPDWVRGSSVRSMRVWKASGAGPRCTLSLTRATVAP
jgi:hypothetical protein